MNLAFNRRAAQAIADWTMRHYPNARIVSITRNRLTDVVAPHLADFDGHWINAGSCLYDWIDGRYTDRIMAELRTMLPADVSIKIGPNCI